VLTNREEEEEEEEEERTQRGPTLQVRL